MSSQISPLLTRRITKEVLSRREQEVLELLALGKCNKEIAASLNIAEITVKCHLSKIFVRLEVTGRTQAIIVAAQQGLVHL